MTQVQLAKRLRVDQSFVSKFETGQRMLDAVQFIIVAEAIGEDPAKMIKVVQSDP